MIFCNLNILHHSRRGFQGLSLPSWKNAALVVVLSIFAALGAEAAPKISAEGPVETDFGTHPAKNTQEAKFTVKNSGDEPLGIVRLLKTCGACAEIKISSEELGPGGEAVITLKVFGSTLSGPYTKNFFVETNDPAQKFFKFTFKGTSVPVAEVRPSNLMYLGRIETGTACKREFLVVPAEKGAEFGEPSAECNYPVKIASAKGDKGLGIVFEFTPEKNLGDMKCKIIIPVLRPEGWPPLEILVSATIAGRDDSPSRPVQGGGFGETSLPKPAPENKPAIAVIEYFHQAGCSDCRMIDTFVIPRLEENFKGRFKIEKYDTALMESFLRFAYRRDRLDIQGNETVCMIVNGKHAFNGYRKIEAGLLNQVSDSLKMGEEPDISSPSGNAVEKDRMLITYADRITLGALIAAGLVDGINPCVFSTLVFFMSLLAVSGVKGRKLVLFGTLYCLSCFMTYLLLGLGILKFMKLFSGYLIFQHVFNSGMAAVLLVFALLSFRDAWIYRKTEQSGNVLLQLPESIKKRIHGIIREGAHNRHLAAGAIATGFLVTLLESVCTGQVYLPALALLAKQYPSSLKWLSYLILYNVMFIIPLAVIFVAAYAGTGFATMIRWSKRDVVIGKILLGLLFIGLAVLLLFLK